MSRKTVLLLVLFLLLIGGLIMYLTMCRSGSPPTQLPGFDASDQTLKDGKPCPYWYKYKNTNQKMVKCDMYGENPADCMDVPTYDAQKANGQLWPCLPLSDYSKTWNVFQKGGENPDDPYGYATCKGAFDAGKCCLPQPGCLPMNRFNWIISTCKGKSCGDWGQFDKDPGNPMVKKTTAARNEGSQVVVNYVAAYRFDTNSDTWTKQPYSSFNTNGKHPAYDLSKPQKDGWMPGPQPGGAYYWRYGWYPAGVGDEGSVGPPAMMFILSTEKCWNMAWFIMNQATLDRGPAIQIPKGDCPGGINANTWACANSSEWDLLESSWSQTGLDEDGSYSNLYATMTNEGAAGRSIWPSYGKNGSGSGGFQKPCYIKGNKNSPQIFVAVIDKTGEYIYNLPVDQADKIWPGITKTTAADTLPARPTQKPKTSPCKDSNNFCCVFAPTSQGLTVDELKKTSSFAPNDKGFCGNYAAENFVDTKQQWGSTPVVLGGIKQPWNEEMECGEGK